MTSFNHDPPYPATTLLTTAIRIILLLFLFSWLIHGALNNTLTFDEPSHLAAGYAFLQQGGDGLWTVPLRGHPVLFNAWEALPIYIADAHLPVETMSGWGSDRRLYTTEFIHTVQGLSAVTLAGRLPSILCTLLLAAVVWRWTTDFWGKFAGCVALLIFCFDPLSLAHGRLATNDMAVTALGMLYLYCMWRWGRKPDRKKAFVIGIILGITLLTKATGAIFGVTGLGWALWVTVNSQKPKSTNQGMLWLDLLVMGVVALGIVWIFYAFSIGPTSALPHLPVPAPEHWDGTLFQANNAAKREVFALGYKKTGRWWWYFPLAFFLKNPLPLLFALLFSVVVFLRLIKTQHTHARNPKTTMINLRFTDVLLPFFFCVVYICAALLIGPNIGYRHFLPIHPFMLLFISGSCTIAWSLKKKLFRLLLTGMLLWYIFGTLLIHPFEISFFNELAGGADQGWRYLTTSNTDWLQGWKTLKTWQEETGILFSYAGPEGYLGLRDYGIDYTPLPPVTGSQGQKLTPWLYPLPGDYILGSSLLSGMNITDVDNYSWFRYREPDAVIAHTLYYYHVQPELSPVWVAQCSAPVVPLDQKALDQGYGQRTLRFLNFDCTRGWIYPDEGQSHGHYILHASQLKPETWRTRLHLTQPSPIDLFTDRHLQNTEMTARERRDQEFPAIGVYAWEPKDLDPLQLDSITAPVTTIPKDLPQVDAPANLLTMEQTLTFLGIQSIESAGSLEVDSWWRVDEGPIDRPLSIMAHLLTSEGQTLAVADGLNVSPVQWQNGDIIVQRHIFPADCKERDELWLRTGIYWLDNQERWSVGDSGHDAIFVALCEKH